MSHIKYFSKYIEYPQPNAKELELGARYYYAGAARIFDSIWKKSHADFQMLESNKIYLTEREAQLRFDWELQESAKKTIPQWFKAYGPEVEFQKGDNEPWEDFIIKQSVFDWRDFKPSEFRAKLKPLPDVVVVVAGVEYRWPPTLKEGHGLSFVYKVYIGSDKVIKREGVYFGSRVHASYAHAIEQLMAHRAFNSL